MHMSLYEPLLMLKFCQKFYQGIVVLILNKKRGSFDNLSFDISLKFSQSRSHVLPYSTTNYATYQL